MIFPKGPPGCRASALALLTKLCDSPEPLPTAVANLVANFPPELRHSELARVADLVEGRPAQ